MLVDVLRGHMDRWIENGFAGEDRRRYEEGLSQPARPVERVLNPAARAELEQAEREGAEKRAELHRQFVAWLVQETIVHSAKPRQGGAYDPR